MAGRRGKIQKAVGGPFPPEENFTCNPIQFERFSYLFKGMPYVLNEYPVLRWGRI